jgi:acyl-CoA thioesterase I
MMLRNAYTLLTGCLLALFLVTACAEGTPITQPVRIVVLGDSLSAGYQLPASESVPMHMQKLFLAAGHTGVRIINMGISGDTTQNGLARLNLVIDDQPDIVLLELGANDMLRGLQASKARKNLALIIETLQRQGITVVLCGVSVPAVFTLGNAQLSAFKPMFSDLADTYGLSFYPDFLKGVRGKKSMNLPDGLHPNATGTQEIAERLYPLLLQAARDVAQHK